MSFTIGSLFDGSGGFPLAASLCGGTPKWASEIEPYPIAVTKSRFPGVKHLGSVTDIKGGEVEPVDVITFGSPCQDLSVAGKRAGLKHEANGDDETTRSGLFMEAVRIIKEMREATNGVYPKFALWENVPGAFSSNKGEDFRIVLEELIKIVEPTAVMPEVPKAGWPYADSYCGDGWSLAYRVLDAQFWGVPQRRRRIYLVADFRGECAGKVSFEREGLRGYFETGRTPWQATTRTAEAGSGAANCEGLDGYNVTSTGELAKTLTAGRNDTHNIPVVCYKNQAITFEPGIAAREGGHIYDSVSGTLRANAGDNQMAVAYADVILDDQGGSQIHVRNDGKCPTLRAEMHGNIPSVMEPICCIDGDKIGKAERAGGSGLGIRPGDRMYTLTAKDVHCVCIPINDKATRWQGGGCTRNHDGSGNGLGVGQDGDPSPTLTAGDRHAVGFLTYQKVTDPLMANSHPGSYTGQDAFSDMLVAGEKPVCYRQGGFAEYIEGEVGTLRAAGGDFGGGSENLIRTQYIVRRLTPTECARLQGFPDTWGHPIEKTKLTEEEYQFWLNVRNTHAAINDKVTKEYTKDQMLKWYSSLHTDSSEYKMWGNGIALPNALYVMQGIADVMSEEKVARRKWLNDLLGDCL